MEAKGISSFLEISINTDKFAHFTYTLNSILTAHERTLQQHGRELQQLKVSMEDRLSRTRKEIQYEAQRSEKKRREDNQYFSSFINDWTLKHERFSEECRERIAGLQQKGSSTIQNTSTSPGKHEPVGEEIQANINEIMKECKQSLQKEVATIAAKMQKMEQEHKASVAANQSLLKNIIQGSQLKVHNEKQLHNSANACNSPRKGERESSKLLNNGLSLQQMTIKEGRQKRRRRVQQRCEQQNLQYASISAKIDQIQSRISAKQNQSLNKVVWANRKCETRNSELSQNNLPVSMNQIQLQRRNLQQNITAKLEHIEVIIEEKFAKIEKEIVRMGNAHGILADEVQITVHKVEKEKARLAELCLQIKKFDEKRLDEKMVDHLMNTMKREHFMLEEKIDKKMSQDVFDREKLRLSQKLQWLSESMPLKADKEEIKRAFEFVEDKIKEIVMIMADDIQQEKDGAIRRVPFKCLSCDKDLECSAAHPRKLQADKKTLSRCNTSQIRKRIRMTISDER